MYKSSNDMASHNSITSRASVMPRASLASLSQQQRSASTTSASSVKSRHLSHLHSQLAQLSANLADLENLLRQTAVQAESMKGLGGWSGGLLMAASKILGDETAAQSSYGAAINQNADDQPLVHRSHAEEY